MGQFLARKSYQAPVSQYNDKNPMPTIDGTPIGAFGAQWAGSGYQYDPSTNPRAQQWMQWMQQSDPTARWQQSEVGGQNQWNFTQDHPGAEGTYPDLARALKPMGGGMTQERVFERGDYVHPDSERYSSPVPLRNSNAIIHTPFGRITPESNLKHPRDMVGTIAPMAIMALATIMSGGAAAPGLLGMLGGGANPIGMMGMNALSSFARNGGHFNPAMLASMGRGFLTGGGGGG